MLDLLGFMSDLGKYVKGWEYFTLQGIAAPNLDFTVDFDIHQRLHPLSIPFTSHFTLLSSMPFIYTLSLGVLLHHATHPVKSNSHPTFPVRPYPLPPLQQSFHPSQHQALHQHLPLPHPAPHPAIHQTSRKRTADPQQPY